jgi:hypothetical protein
VASAQQDPETIAVFVDTNSFIQARDLKDLAWRTMFPGVRRVIICVVPVVVDELDQQKNGRNQRVRDRARKALKMIKDASRAQDMTIKLKTSADFTVVLRLADPDRIDWSKHQKLDSARPDDNLVAEALETAIDAPKVLLSHDTGPLIRARRCALDARELPIDWLLQDTADEDAREIARLKRENETLRNRHPSIKIAWEIEGEAVDEVAVERLKLPPLTEPEIRDLTAAYLNERPKEKGIFYPSLGFSIGTETGFTQGDFERYSAEYDKFAEKLPHWFEKLHTLVEQASPMTQIDFRVLNSGSATAEGFTVDFEVSDEWLVFGNEEAAVRHYGIRSGAPTPPLSPQLKMASEADALARSMFSRDFGPAPPRDPTGFYWEDRPAAIDHRGSLRCEQFRAKASWRKTIWIYPWGEDLQSASLSLEAHAANLSDPVSAEVRLSAVSVEVDWTDPRVATRLEAAIRPLIARQFGGEPAAAIDQAEAP